MFVDDDCCGLGDYHDLAVMVEAPVKNKGMCAHMKEHGTYCCRVCMPLQRARIGYQLSADGCEDV